MPLLGSHLSIAGGYHKAPEAAGALGMDTVQIFTKSNAQWRAKPITDEVAERFTAAVTAAKLQKPCAHASYLINLASPDETLWARSTDAFVIELDRAEQLGLDGVVLHPGTATGISPDEGLANVVRALDTALERSSATRVEVWLEGTAGQGASLGHRFEHLAELIDRAARSDRLGICLDTCHLFAAGYPLIAKDEFDATIRAFDEVVGLPRLRAVHLNDSKKPLGSRVDRHEHIGEGCLGLEPFRHLLNDRRFASLPMYLETPKGERDGVDLDAVNLRCLRGLLRAGKQTAAPRKRARR